MSQGNKGTYNTSPSARLLGSVIFASRWLQAPIYLGLIVAQLVYVVVFIIDLWHLVEDVIAEPGHLEESHIMLAVLGLIDVAMIANLLIMVIIGGYETFVSRINLNDHPDEPEWLSHVNANVLKVKLAMAIIGISSIHLLKSFIEVAGITSETSVTTDEGRITVEGVFWQVIIHITFILSAIALAYIDRLKVKGDLEAIRTAYATGTPVENVRLDDPLGVEEFEPREGRQAP